MLNNILKPGRVGGKYGDSQFRRIQNADLGENCVKACLIQNFDAIQAYIQKHQEDPSSVRDSELFHMEFTTTKPDGTKIPDYIGLGYRLTGATGKKREGEITGAEMVQTNAVACIIRPSVDNPDGWEITSAFPMVTPRPSEMTKQTSIKKLQKDFEPVLKNTFTYKEANPIMQAYLETTCSGNQVDPLYRTVYSPKTQTRPPLIMISQDTRHPDFKSEYPRITIYANERPPANASLFLSKDQKIKLGSERSLETLEQADPKMANLYRQFVEKMPDEFRPNGLPYKKPDQPTVKPMFRQNNAEQKTGTAAKAAEAEIKPAAPEKPARTATRSSRNDPRFDAIANEIESSGEKVTGAESQLS